ncbi:MAG: biotin/lipoyl-binding protein [Archaeoglobaceae archaeon]|nr:biotin/lipoyl-binding protein [Archaeoglobaceae archaeon]
MKEFTIKVDGEEYKVNVERIGEGIYKVRIGNKTAKVVIESGKLRKVEHPGLVKKDELIKEVKDKIKIDSNVVTAMLPGTIVKILVEVGEEVKVGQTLLILEAMKMENEVVSPKDGVVKEIKVKEGMRVETGDALVVIE